MKAVYTHFDHWLPRLPFINQGAMTLGHHIFFARPQKVVSFTLIKHELIHVGQIEKVGLIRFYVQYCLEFVWQLIFRSGLNWDHAYRQISFEMQAYANQDKMWTYEERDALAAGGFVNEPALPESVEELPS